MENDEIEIIKIKDRLLDEINSDLSSVVCSGGSSATAASLSRLLNNIQNFQPSPQLLDKRLNGYITSLCTAYDLNTNSQLNHHIGEIFYQFTKVRGYKAISNCLSSDVYLIRPILEKFPNELGWKENFYLILWLSILILNPFKLSTVDHQLSQKVYDLSLSFFVNNSKELDVAAILMSKFLSRSDNAFYLNEFLQRLSIQSTEYVRLSYLKTLNNLLKIGKLSTLDKYLDAHYNFVELNLDSDNQNVLKYSIKILGKLSGFAITLDRVELLENIINYLISKLDHNSTIIRYCVSKQLAKVCVKIDEESRQGLLSMLLQDLEISNFVEEDYKELNIDSDLVNVNKYHGTLLTLAELLNMKLIPQSSLPGLISILHRTLFLEQNRLTHSVGSNIRDLSCYISWSLIKKYRTIDPLLLCKLFQDLLLTCLFDKDIMIRRSASAVIQELIGRFGDVIYSNFSDWKLEPNRFKLKIIEVLDFVVLGDLKKSFQLSQVITDNINTVFKNLFTSHLYGMCFSNDCEIRKLSIKHLVGLIDETEAPSWIEQTVSKAPKPGYFYLLSELIQLHPSRLEEISRIVSEQTFNLHRDNHLKGEELLYIISVLVEYNDSIFQDNLELVFNIIRVSTSPEILEKFFLLLENLPSVSNEFFDKLVYYIKMGNNLAVAKGFRALKHFSDDHLDQVLAIIEDQKQDSQVRATLIDSLAIFFNKNPSENVIRIINQLDDYTITSQGDVGSKLRSSALRFIDQNLHTLSQEPNLMKYIILKLVRLNFDTIDRLRNESFELFMKMYGLSDFSSEANYFDMLLEIYQTVILYEENSEYSDLLSFEFVKGYGLIAGGVISSNKLIQGSLKSFFYFMEKKFDENTRLGFLNRLSLVLSKNTQFSLDSKQCVSLGIEFDFELHQVKCKDRLFKLQNAILILFERIFESNLQIPDEFDYKALFIKVFNLQLNQSNQTRLKACFKIFKHLYLTKDAFFKKGKARMIQMLCTSKNDRIRVMCSEILYELYFESEGENDLFLKKLDSVNWSAQDDFTRYLQLFK